MAFTRFHDDPARIAKRLEESTFAGNYQLNKPGPGVDLPFKKILHNVYNNGEQIFERIQSH